MQLKKNGISNVIRRLAFCWRPLLSLALAPALFATLLTLPHTLLGQQISHQLISTKDGLPDNTVYAVTQDDQGFLWIGTQLGLAKYDGTTFYTLEHPSASRAILQLTSAPDGTLWFCNIKNEIFYIRNDTILTLNQEIDLSPFLGGAFLPTVEGAWLTNEDRTRFSFLRYRTKTITESYVFPDRVLDIFPASTSLVLQERKVCILRDGEATSCADLPGFPWQGNSRFVKLPDGGLYIYNQWKTSWLSVQLSEDSFQIDKVPLPSYGRTYAVHPVDDRRAWLGTDMGAWLVDLTTGEVELRLGGAQQIYGILPDQEGSHWLAMPGVGVLFFPALDILSYPIELDEKEQVSLRRMTFCREDNVTLMGTAQGHLLLLKDGNLEVIELSDQHGIVELECLGAGHYRVWTTGKVYFEIDDREVKQKSLPYYFNKAVRKLSATTYLGGSHNAFLRLEMTPDGKQQERILERRAVNLFQETVRDRAWLIGLRELYQYENGQVKLFQHEAFKDKQVISMAQLPDSSLWFATYGNGVMVMQRDSIIRTYTENDGLASNFSRLIAADPSANCIWVSSVRGLSRIDLINQSIDVLNGQDGLLNSDVTSFAFNDKYLWIGGQGGFTEFPKAAIDKNNYAPPIFLTHFKIDERDTVLADHHKLQYHQNNLYFEFSGLSYRSWGNMYYRYRLLGLDTNWVVTGRQANFARFPSLQPGRYEFQVLAVNEDGLMQAQPASLSFEIALPFWRTWWFISLVFLSTIGFVSGVFYLLLQQTKRRHHLHQQLLRSQMNAQQARINPHFLFNILNTLQAFIIEKNLISVNKYLGKFALLLRAIFKLSDEEFLSLKEELEVIQLYLELENLRYDGELDIEYLLPTNDQLAEVKVPVMLIQPYVENAIKHGLGPKQGARRLSLKIIIEEEGLLRCTIADNGIGREASQTRKHNRNHFHKSSGMAVTEKRIALLRAYYDQRFMVDVKDLYHPDGQAAGTEVILSIPYQEM